MPGYTHVQPVWIPEKPQDWIHPNTLINLIIFKLSTDDLDLYNKDQ